MAKVHAMTSGSGGDCRVLIHLPMPTGNNAAGCSWLSLGRNTTRLQEGDGVGQISASEKAQIVAGDILEIEGAVPLEVVRSGVTAINALVDALITGSTASLREELKYYGKVYGS